MDFQRDIALFIVCGLAVLLFLCNFNVCGLVGSYIAGFLFGLFGLPNYIFPIIFVGSVFFLISNYENRIAVFKCVAVYAIYLLISTFIGIVMYGRIGEDAIDAVASYTYGFSNHTGGGLIGGFLAGLLIGWFGTIGAYLLDILVIAVLVFLVIERSPVRAILSGGQMAESRMKERMLEREEERQETVAASAASRRHRLSEPEDVTLPESRRDEITRDEQGRSGSPRTANKVSGITDTDLRPIEQRVTINRHSEEMTEIQGIPHAGIDRQTAPDANASARRSGNRKVTEIKNTAIPEETLVKKTIIPINGSNTSATLDDAIISAETVPQMEREVKKPTSSTTQVAAERDMPAEAKPTVTRQVKAENTAGEAGVDQIANEIKSAPKPKRAKKYLPPSIELLKKAKATAKDSEESLYQTAQKLEKTLSNFGIEAQVVDISQGPSVTRYEVQPAVGVKVSRIVNLSDDLKLNLAATDIRIEAPVPGKSVVGIEIPNKNAVTVSFRELIESGEFKTSKSPISFAAGRDLTGKIIISDIDKMPHVLIAGATGSGKSVCINTIIMSILYHTGPDDVKFIMVDPKIVELSVYNGIPHLLIPVVTDPKKAAGALMWAVKEMTDRYQKFADAGVRKIDDYNAKIVDGYIKKTVNGEQIAEQVSKMPRIVVIVDELADLMMVASSEVEDAITRLTQLARAAGIHLIIATQRPSADVITGVIKANMPSRIAFAVTSAINSRIILDTSGAEKLLGKGDMLYYPQGYPQPLRVQGAFVSDDEIASVCAYLKSMDYGTDEGREAIENQINSMNVGNSGGSGTATAISSDDTGDDKDSLFEEAGRVIIETEKASIGMLQRKFKIGFNRAARIMDQLCEAGVVGGEEGTKPRKILMTIEEFEQIL